MTELKTLKDLEKQDWSTHEEDVGLVRGVFWELRKEAIKWVKHLSLEIEKHSHKKFDINYHYNECPGCRNKFVQIKWIVHFFNITEEELK